MESPTFEPLLWLVPPSGLPFPPLLIGWFSCQVMPDSCDPMDCSLSGSSVHGTLQARILERVAEPSFKGSSQPRDQTLVSYISALAGGFFTTSITGNLLTPFKSQAQS